MLQQYERKGLAIAIDHFTNNFILIFFAATSKIGASPQQKQQYLSFKGALFA